MPKQSVSVWMGTAKTPEFYPLVEPKSCDVCIVGAGIAGLTTAYILSKNGQSVIVLDDGPIGGGETQRTTAHLSNVIDNGYVEIERLRGAQGATLAAESHGAAIDQIESIVEDEKIRCHFRRMDGYLIAAYPDHQKKLEEEYAAATRAGLLAEWTELPPGLGWNTGRAIRFRRQAQFHPLRYVEALSAVIRKLGGKIYTGTHVQSIKGGEPAMVTCEKGAVVSCKAVVVATNSPINNLVVPHLKQAGYCSYVLAFEFDGHSDNALFWDTDDPYHYVRFEKGGKGQYLIVGGEDHKTGQESDPLERFAALERWARRHFSGAGNIAYRWSGQVMETFDGLAFIGHNPTDEPNIFIATGDSGMGMTHGTLAGMILQDLILGKQNKWAKLYDPSRKKFKASMDFAKENLNTAAQYGEWLTPGDEKWLEKIKPGNGAVLRKNLKKVAVYRDENGLVHAFSAVCPHLGCLVEWNKAESSWDCPCHGSRFDCQGKVQNGPANSDLSASAASRKIEKSLTRGRT